MALQIQKLSYYAETVSVRLKAARVHSVYRRTINLTDGNDILSLQAAGSPLSPLSLISTLCDADIDALAVLPGDPVIFHDSAFQIIGQTRVSDFSYANAKRYDLALSGSLSAQACSFLSANIKTALSLAHTGSGFEALFQSEALSPVLSVADARIRHAAALVSCEKYKEAAAELSRLIGLGTGLTPSGDDFLCGVLAGLSLLGKKNHPFTRCLTSEIASRLSDTIDISAAFLSCALQNNYSLAVNHLLQVPTPDVILAEFTKIGHSSGIDTLCGVYWGLCHIP